MMKENLDFSFMREENDASIKNELSCVIALESFKITVFATQRLCAIGKAETRL